jgi:hypothetical protein
LSHYQSSTIANIIILDTRYEIGFGSGGIDFDGDGLGSIDFGVGFDLVWGNVRSMLMVMI